MLDLDTQTISTLATVALAISAYRGIAWVGVKTSSKWLKKRISDPYVRGSHCIEVKKEVVASVKESMNQLMEKQEAFLVDVKALVKQRTFEDGIKRKHDIIVSNATTYMEDKGVKDFAVIKAERMREFIMDNYITMWDSNYELFRGKIYALATTVKEEGIHLAGAEYVNFFYQGYHTKAVVKYISDVKEIFNDRVNNKSERFVDASMLFMTRFLSDMVNAYTSFIRESIME